MCSRGYRPSENESPCVRYPRHPEDPPMKKFALPLVLLALAFVFLAIWRLTRNPGTTAPEEAAVPAAPAQPKDAVAENQLSALDHSDPALAETDREDLPTAAAGEQGLETWEIA